MVARYVGAKDEDNANLAALQAMILMMLASGTLGLIGFVLVEPLMRFVGADAAMLPLAVRYARILFTGLIAMEMVPSVGGMMSAAGAPRVRLSMRLWTTCVMLVAEPLLVQRMGLEGAVLALVGSHVVGTVWGLWVLLVGRAAVRIDMHQLRLDFPMMGRILRITLPATQVGRAKFCNVGADALDCGLRRGDAGSLDHCQPHLWLCAGAGF